MCLTRKKKMNKSFEELVEMDNRILAEQVAMPILPSSGFIPFTLTQAIVDAKLVRLTALTDARQALQDAFEDHNIW